MTRTRCEWSQGGPEMIAYHDTEWGVPTHDDRVLFEFLLLEGAQAGLSWSTILGRREGYRAAFAGFDPAQVASFDEAVVERLVADPGIVRHRQKIRSAITNAGAVLELQAEHGSLDRYLWSFVDGEPVQNTWTTMGEIPAVTETSEQLSKALKQQGLSFVGPTIIYAFMQSVGMVNDHLTTCFRHAEVADYS